MPCESHHCPPKRTPPAAGARPTAGYGRFVPVAFAGFVPSSESWQPVAPLQPFL